MHTHMCGYMRWPEEGIRFTRATVPSRSGLPLSVDAGN